MVESNAFIQLMQHVKDGDNQIEHAFRKAFVNYENIMTVTLASIYKFKFYFFAQMKKIVI